MGAYKHQEHKERQHQRQQQLRFGSDAVSVAVNATHSVNAAHSSSPNPGRRAEPTRARIAPSRSGSSPAACCARSRTRPTRRPARSTACAASASISPERNAPSRQRSGSCSPSPLWPRRSIPERPRQTLRSALPRYGKAIGASRRAHPNRRRRASQDIQRGARTERRREPTPPAKDHG